MTFFLIGHDFKYETEATVKLFFPAMRFAFCTEDAPCAGDFIRTVFTEDRILVETSLSGVFRRQEVPLSPDGDKHAAEHALCRTLYAHLMEATGVTPPWGMLTGIRPVRMLTAAVEQGSTLEQAAAHMQQTYLVSEKKLALAKATARVQLPLLQGLAPDAISLYISIPFCPSRCSYCSFVSHSIAQAKHLMPEYIRLLCRELEIWGDIIQKLQVTVDTIYFGGGTPTSISAEALEQLLQTVVRVFDLSKVREFCVEAGRPDTITREKLEVLKRYGVDRISVNPQTMEDAVLQQIGRKHTSAQIAEAFQLAREVGFTNINMDLIAGLPHDTPEGFHRTLEKVLALNPDSITVHTLTLKRAATLFSDRQAQIGNPVREMVRDSIALLPEHGYQPYYMYRQKNTIDNQENVGYARAGKESYYNMLIMDESQSIFGAGCAASTKIVEPDCGRITRIHNYKFPYEYIRQFDQLMEKKQQVLEIYQRMEAAEQN